MTSKRNNEEHRIQAGIIEATSYIKLCEWLHAIPNGGNRDVITGKLLKDEGVKPGVLDLFLPIPRGAWHGLYIEVKTPNGSVSEDQRRFIKHCDRFGYKRAVVRSVQAGVDAIVNYLGMA